MTPVKNDGQLNVRLPEEVLATLLKIEARHGVTPNEALRKLAVSAAAFFDKHGWFTFPATVMPEHFQNPIFMEKTEKKTPEERQADFRSQAQLDSLAGKPLNQQQRDAVDGLQGKTKKRIKLNPLPKGDVKA